jgi:hypothetical protein
VLEALLTIGSIGKDLRAERNKRAHEGIQRPFGEDSDDTLIFKVAAMSKGSGTVQNFNLEQEYLKHVSLLYDTYFKEAQALRDAVFELQELLLDPFYDRFEQKESSKTSHIQE